MVSDLLSDFVVSIVVGMFQQGVPLLCFLLLRFVLGGPLTLCVVVLSIQAWSM